MTTLSSKTKNFDKCLSKLSKDLQVQARDKFLMWRESHQSIGFKELKQCSGIYSAEINGKNRALCYKDTNSEGKDHYVWFWIGSHEDYNNAIHNQKSLRAVIHQIRDIGLGRKQLEEVHNNGPSKK